MAVVRDLKRLGEIGAGFLGTDAVAGYTSSRLTNVVAASNGVQVAPKSKYSQVGAGLLGAAYVLFSIYATSKLPDLNPDLHYVVTGATAGLLTNGIYNLVAAAVMNKTLSGLAGEAVKLLAEASMASW